MVVLPVLPPVVPPVAGTGAVASGAGCLVPLTCGLAGPVGTGAARVVAGALLKVIVGWLTGGATWVAGQALHLAAGPSRADLGQAWFRHLVRVATSVAALVALPLALAGTVGAVVRQDARRLARVWAVGVPLGLAGGALAVTFAALSVRAVDGLCTVIAPPGGAGALVLADFARLARAPVAVQALLAGLVLLGAVALWLELILRSAAVYLAVFFLPIALATLIWPAAAPAARRFVEVLAALILSELVIVGALAVGTAALGAHETGIEGTLTAVAVLLLTAFAPFAVLRLLPIVETAGIAHLEGEARRPVRAARGVATVAAREGQVVGAVVDHLVNREAGGLDVAEPTSSVAWQEEGDYYPDSEEDGAR